MESSRCPRSSGNSGNTSYATSHTIPPLVAAPCAPAPLDAANWSDPGSPGIEVCVVRPVLLAPSPAQPCQAVIICTRCTNIICSPSWHFADVCVFTTPPHSPHSPLVIWNCLDIFKPLGSRTTLGLLFPYSSRLCPNLRTNNGARSPAGSRLVQFPSPAE